MSEKHLDSQDETILDVLHVVNSIIIVKKAKNNNQKSNTITINNH